jgi:hypothetical protein
MVVLFSIGSRLRVSGSLFLASPARDNNGARQRRSVTSFESRSHFESKVYYNVSVSASAFLCLTALILLTDGCYIVRQGVIGVVLFSTGPRLRFWHRPRATTTERASGAS